MDNTNGMINFTDFFYKSRHRFIPIMGDETISFYLVSEAAVNILLERLSESRVDVIVMDSMEPLTIWFPSEKWGPFWKKLFKKLPCHVRTSLDFHPMERIDKSIYKPSSLKSFLVRNKINLSEFNRKNFIKIFC